MRIDRQADWFADRGRALIGSSLLSRLFLIGLLVLGGLAYLNATSMGAGLSPDSAQYITAARSLIRGEGVSFPDGEGAPVPITLWPPMYPLLLASLIGAGIDVFAAARGLGLALYLLNALLVYGITVVATHRSRKAGLIALVLFLVTVDTLAVHTWAWSEATFLALGFGGMFLILQCLDGRRGTAYWLAAVLLGGSSLTRYPGVAFLLGASLMLVLFSKPSGTSRLLDTGRFAAVGALPVALWMVRNVLVSGNAVSRTFSSRGVGIWEVKSALHVMTLWFIPGRFEGEWRIAVMIAGLILLFLVALFVFFLQRQESTPPLSKVAVVMLGTALVSYLGVVLSAKMFMEPNFPIDDPRYLAPVLILLLLIGVVTGHEAVRRLQSTLKGASASLTEPAVPLLVILGVAYFASFNVVHLVRWVAETAGRGQGFASRSWQESDLMAYVAALPEDTLLYSNGYDVITLFFDRPAHPMPLKLHARPDRREVDYDREIADMADALKAADGLMVYFNGITWRRMTEEADILEQVPMDAVFTAAEGAIYRVQE